MIKFNKTLLLYSLLILFTFQVKETLSQDQLQAFTQDKTAIASSLGASDWSEMLFEKPGLIMDVRTPDEYDEGYIRGAKLFDITSSSFMSEIQELNLNKGEPIYIYSRSGKRSKKAMSVLSDNGFTQIYELNDGFIGWEKAGYPTN